MDTLTNEHTLVLTHFRTPLIALSLIVLFNFLVLIFLYKKLDVKQLAFINLLTVFFASVSVLAQGGNIVNQFGLVGDSFSFYLILTSSIIFFAGIFIFTKKPKKKKEEEK
ncbi:MAG TPA: hypothetical protein VJY47_01985 [Candidatus Dojkabacteria bacterium]|nr:hypothetical protein [Candidatus Dojkabacteria bacterium]